jgi:hypothetical protein
MVTSNLTVLSCNYQNHFYDNSIMTLLGYHYNFGMSPPPPLTTVDLDFLRFFYFDSSPSLKDNAQPILKATEIIYK